MGGEVNTMTGLTVMDYRPSAELDNEVASLVVEAVRGWPDHAPVTAPMVRSAFRPTGTVATSLVLHRDDQDTLDGIAAILWPATLESIGSVWGPILGPSARGHGLARTMLDTLTTLVGNRPGVRVRTAPIPQSRTRGWELFESSGWVGTATSSLLTRPIEGLAELPGGPVPPVPVRSARQGEYLDQALATLFAAARPELGYATARDTYQRWASDVRYAPDRLLLTEGEAGLTGAALVYASGGRQDPDPSSREYFSRSTSRPEPGIEAVRQAVLADVVIAPSLPAEEAQEVRKALVYAALRAGAGVGAQEARAESGCPDLIATLRDAGFQVSDQYRYYEPSLEPRS